MTATAQSPSLTDAAANVDRIAKALATAEQELAELEQGRAQVALTDGDIDGYHVALFKAEATVKTLRAGLAEANASHGEALAAEAQRQVEALSAIARQRSVPALVHVYGKLEQALRDVCSAANELVGVSGEILDFNAAARRAERDDLIIPLSSVRATAIAALTDGADLPVPTAEVVRLGETDEAYVERLLKTLQERAEQQPRRGEKQTDFERRLRGVAFAKRAFVAREQGEKDDVYQRRLLSSAARELNLSPFLGTTGASSQSPEESEREYHWRIWAEVAKKLGVTREGESDEAYHMRVLRQHRKASEGKATSDPIRAAGERAIEVIREHALGLSPAEQVRLFPAQRSAQSLRGHSVNDAEGLIEYSHRNIRSIRAQRG